MRCPECDFIFSDDFDLCPGCRSDVREWKRRLDLPILFPEESYQQLRQRFEDAARTKETKHSNDNDSLQPGKPSKRSILKSWINSVSPQPSPRPSEAVVTNAAPVEHPHSNSQELTSRLEAISVADLSPAQAQLFAALERDAQQELVHRQQSLRITNTLPAFEAVSWRFDEIIKEARGQKTVNRSKRERKLSGTEKLNAHAIRAELEQSAPAKLVAYQLPIIPPTFKEIVKAAFLFLSISAVLSAVLLLGGYLFLWKDAPAFSSWVLLRNAFAIYISVSWFLAFWPLLNDAKLIGGFFLVEENGRKAGLKKLFYRGLLFPPILLLQFWIFGARKGLLLHSWLMGLKVSTVAG